MIRFGRECFGREIVLEGSPFRWVGVDFRDFIFLILFSLLLTGPPKSKKNLRISGPRVKDRFRLVLLASGIDMKLSRRQLKENCAIGAGHRVRIL